MPAKTPVARGTSGFPAEGVYAGTVAAASARLTNATFFPNRNGMLLDIFYFADIDDTDTWSSGIPNIAAVAWQPDTATGDLIGATVTTQATGVVTFSATNANSNGWLWVLRGH